MSGNRRFVLDTNAVVSLLAGNYDNKLIKQVLDLRSKLA
jgi:hypothetical protein